MGIPISSARALASVSDSSGPDSGMAVMADISKYLKKINETDA